MRVLFGRKDAEDIIVFVNGFAVVASLLLVPPIAIGVAELALLRWGLDITAVLEDVD